MERCHAGGLVDRLDADRRAQAGTVLTRDHGGRADNAGAATGERAGRARTLGRDGRADRVLARAAARVGDDRFNRYLGAHTDVRITEDGLEVCVPDKFTADLLGRTVGGDLREAVRAELAAEGAGAVGPGVRFTIRAPRRERPGADVPVRAPKGAPPPAGRTRRVSQAAWRTLDDFLVGSSNRVAYAAAERVADGVDAPRVLIIHGACGVGKSHLVEGLASRARRGGARVKVTTGEAFTSGFVNAIRRRGGEYASVEAFQRAHRAVDVLCVDDAHVVAGRDKTQQELIQTIEALGAGGRSGGGRIVLVTDRHPAEVEKLHAALASRLSAGLVVRVDAPEPELVRRLIDREAARRTVALTPEAREMLAGDVERRGGGAREIQGSIAQIDAVRRLSGGASAVVDRAVVETAWRHRRCVRHGAARMPIGLDAIRGEVCRVLGVTESELMGPGRVKRVVLARLMVVALGRRMTNASFPEIARAMGKRNHTTAITQMRRVEQGIASGERVGVGCVLDGLTLSEAIERLDRAARVAQGG